MSRQGRNVPSLAQQKCAGNPFPASFAPFKPAQDSVFFTPLETFGSFAGSFRPGYMETFHLTVERELMRNLVARGILPMRAGAHHSPRDGSRPRGPQAFAHPL